jgi:hypothetical protein
MEQTLLCSIARRHLMSMRDSLWKVAEVISTITIGALILTPGRMEGDFIRSLYAANPIYCIALLTALGAVIAATLIHWANEQRRKKTDKSKAAPNSTAL